MSSLRGPRPQVVAMAAILERPASWRAGWGRDTIEARRLQTSGLWRVPTRLCCSLSVSRISHDRITHTHLRNYRTSTSNRAGVELVRRPVLEVAHDAANDGLAARSAPPGRGEGRDPGAARLLDGGVGERSDRGDEVPHVGVVASEHQVAAHDPSEAHLHRQLPIGGPAQLLVELLDLVDVDGGGEPSAVTEVVVDERARHAGGIGHLLEAHLVGVPAVEDRRGGLDEERAARHRVQPGLALALVDLSATHKTPPSLRSVR